MAETNERVKLKRGKSSSLPTEKESGSILIETDTGTAYVDNSNTDRVQLKDPTKLPLTGGAVTGDIDLGDNNLTTTHEPSDDSDVVNKKYVDSSVHTYTGESPIIVENDVISHKEYGEQSGGEETSKYVDYDESFKVPYIKSDETGHVETLDDVNITFPSYPREVEHAASADEATHATSADTATEADHATSATTANQASGLTEPTFIDGIEFSVGGNMSHYGTCSTAAGTASKAVVCQNEGMFECYTGVCVDVKFSNTNTASAPTLNVDNTGSKSIRYNGSALSSATANYLLADHVYRFVYDGSYYNIVGDINTDSETEYTAEKPITIDADNVIHHDTYPEQSGGPNSDITLDYGDSFDVPHVVSDETGHVTEVTSKEITLPDAPKTADSLTEARTIDGVEFDGTSNIIHYGSCTTAAGTKAKTVSCSDFILGTGASIKVIFSNTNTAESPTLNVNSTGAKSIYTSNGEQIVANYGTLLKDTVYEFIYDGTQYYMVTGPLNRVDTVEDDQTEFRNCIVVEPGVDLDELDVPVGTMIMVKEESSIPASKVAITYDQTTETLKIFDEE